MAHFTSVYPTAIDSAANLGTAIDNVTPVTAAYLNQFQSTSIAIETELGLKPSGTYGTVRARLDAMQSQINSISGGGGGGSPITFSGDIVGSSTSQEVVGLRGYPISPLPPVIGDSLIFNGSQYVPGVSGFSPGGDLSGTATSQTVIGIRSTPVSNTAPVSGLPLIFNGTDYIPSANFTTNNITTTGSISSGPAIASSVTTGVITLTGKLVVNAVSITPAPSPETGQGVLYFDTTSNLFKVSQDGGHTYINLLSSIQNVPVTTVNSFPYTVSSSDYYLAVQDGVTRTITLPASPSVGETVTIKDVSGTAFTHNIVVSGNGNTIDGISSFTMNNNYESMTVTFVGSGQWSIS